MKSVRWTMCACLSTFAALGLMPARAQGQVRTNDASQETPSPAATPAPPLIPIPPAHPRPDDKRRTLRSYGHNLGYNFLAVLQRDNRKALLIAGALTAPSFALDRSAKRYFEDHPHESFGRIGADIGGTATIAGLSIGIFSAGRISRGDTFRSASYDLSQAIIVNLAYTFALKVATQRERPDRSNERSFPSGHASNAFAMASVMARHYGKLAVPTYAFGAFVALSRLAAQKHHFSDIVAGSGLGVSVGRAVVRRNGRPPDPKPGEAPAAPPAHRTTWQIVPYAGPAHDGRGLALLVGF